MRDILVCSGKERELNPLAKICTVLLWLLIVLRIRSYLEALLQHIPTLGFHVISPLTKQPNHLDVWWISHVLMLQAYTIGGLSLPV
jgi:hypothetical protein